ncbi:MAG TPA: lipoprotein insertase outer membrane protein LolB [Rhodocyclaceae bacterium]
MKRLTAPHAALLLALCFPLGACELLPQSVPTTLLRPQMAAGFNLDGRLSLQRGETAYHVGIQWRHSIDEDEILLNGPLGQGVAELRRDLAGVHLRSADGREAHGSDWEALSAQVLGVPLPLGGLSHWLLGEAVVELRDEQGRPRRASADGWQIDYLEYASDAADALPTLVEMNRDDIKARLRIDGWQGSGNDK